MSKINLIFDLELSGHHIEYLHHLYIGAGTKINENFVFAVPEDFIHKSSSRTWPEYKNIKFYFIKSSKINKCSGNLLYSSFNSCKLLSEVNNDVKSDKIFLIEFMRFIPFISLFLNKKIFVSGIIYKIYLYQWKHFNFLNKVMSILKYEIISKSKVIKKVYILNDEFSANYLNKIYDSKKFIFLPDPFVVISNGIVDIYTSKLKIDNDVQIILHFGAMSDRKGTLEILKMISLMDLNLRKKYLFVFAGKVGSDIKVEFYKLYNELIETSNIEVYDEFCSFELLGSLCEAANYILVPYKLTFLSSGILGYAAQYKTPVIGPRDGLLGKLIKQYRLGFLLREITSKSLLLFFENFEKCKNNRKMYSDKYLKNNSVDLFVKKILG